MRNNAVLFKLLVKTRLAAYGAWLTGGMANKNNGRGKKLLYAGLMCYAAVAFMFLFGTSFAQLAPVFYAENLAWLYFTFWAIASFAMQVIGSVFTAKAQLFEAKDNDLLLSMPVPPSLILLSRMTALWLFNHVFHLSVSVPAIVCWVRAAGFSTGGFLSFLVAFLFLPFLALALSCLFGWLLALLTRRFRKTQIFSVLFSLLFLGVYFVGYNRLTTYIMDIAQNSAAVAQRVASVRVLYHLGGAAAGEEPLSLLLLAAVCLVPFLLVYLLLTKSLVRLLTVKKGFAKIRYEEKEMKPVSVGRALLIREFRRLGASSVYMMNAGLGLVFALAGAVAAVFLRDKILPFLATMPFPADLEGVWGVIGALLVCMLGTMTMFTACTVSIEGKTLWILRSLPVPSSVILEEKVRMHASLVLPVTVAASLAVVYVLFDRLDLLSGILVVLVPAAYALLCAYMGLLFNLKHPSLNWTNETQAVKQGISVLLTMLFNFAAVAVPGALYFALAKYVSGGLFLLFVLALFVISLLLARRWIRKKGCAVFEALPV